jgi:hypothetical protein
MTKKVVSENPTPMQTTHTTGRQFCRSAERREISGGWGWRIVADSSIGLVGVVAAESSAPRLVCRQSMKSVAQALLAGKPWRSPPAILAGTGSQFFL